MTPSRGVVWLLASVLPLALGCQESPPDSGDAGGGQASPNIFQQSASLPEISGLQDCTRPIRAVRNGDEVAAVFLDGPTLLFQRFSLRGQAIHAPITLGTVEDTPRGSNLALASDGQRYVACWDSVTTQPTESRAFCSALPVAGGEPAMVLTQSGSSPSVAAGPLGLAVAIRSGKKATVRYLAPVSTAPERELTLSEEWRYDADRVLLASSPGGLVLVTPEAQGFHRLDANLDVIAGPLRFDEGSGLEWAGLPQLAVVGEQVAISVRKPYGNHFYRIDAQNAVHPLFDIDGGSKSGSDVALASDGTSLHVAWTRHDPGASIRHLAFDPNNPPTIEQEDLQQGSLREACSMAIVAVPGATLAVHATQTGVAALRMELR